MGGVQRVKLAKHIAERPARARVQFPGTPQLHTLEAPVRRQNREGEAESRSVTTNTNVREEAS